MRAKGAFAISTSGRYGALRTVLKHATSTTHDQLDAAVLPVALAPDPVPFLRFQYEARLGVEDWLETLGRSSLPRPPRLTPLIAADLAALDAALPPAPTFAGADTSTGAQLAAAWCLAGSSLGNRAIAAARRKAGLDAEARFFADPGMPAFWAAFLPHLDVTLSAGETAAATATAQAVFAHFRASLPLPAARAAA